jgi:hypothetical protein
MQMKILTDEDEHVTKPNPHRHQPRRRQVDVDQDYVLVHPVLHGMVDNLQLFKSGSDSERRSS